MENDKEKLNLLLLKLENLSLRQQHFETEIQDLRNQIRQLQFPGDAVEQTQPTPILQEHKIVFPPKNTPISTAKPVFKQTTKPKFSDNFKRASYEKSDFEKFIGENLISKIGILILVIGVAIGAKYAIDKDMLSPLTRIILGYLVGIGLMGFAIKLKAKYESFSAVLLSGAIAIMYFLTYAAYDFNSLIPQALAFGLMVIFTSFTVVAAIKYNKQVIAHIGLVGAYAVPFLLSDGSGKVAVLFSYMAIINIGILILSFKKYWKPLFYLSFGLTWIIFASWLFMDFSDAKHFNLALGFSSIFFLIFYVSNLAYKVNKAEVFGITDVIILLLNSFVFYGIGYFILSEKHGEYLGLFTLLNAIIHFVVSLVIYKRKLADKNLFYFVLAMVITFITMAVPVQLSGNWVTIFWAVEASILFYLGRMKGISIYEKLSYPLIFLAFFSLLQDWTFTSSEFNYLVDYTPTKPFLNVGFLSAIVFIGAFAFMFTISRKAKNDEQPNQFREMFSYIIPSILVAVIYYTFRKEIANVFENLYQVSKINIKTNANSPNFVYNYNYPLFKTACVYIYTMFFASAFTSINLKKIKSKDLAVSNAIINLITILAFLTQGLYVLSELRQAYISQSDKYFVSTSMNIGIRYISLAFFATLIASCYLLSKSKIFKAKLKTAFDYVLYIAILWVLSSELLHILELSGLKTGYKLGLSILWGVYALFLIAMGLWKNKKYLRIGAIMLFAITLLKLFFYDMASLDTISRTIVFVSLGVLLLIISFLYNKYKHLIIDDDKTEI
ncbi:DUF2339 domain-containing protein [Pedobacter cryotolerans]|uniref:DUF2339 domain-containing protein n=1 Tax=Pedobacter cryotolerans TaxID=2571270 RepID=A0A4V5NXS7_9SPHI|nr:DUF2339 domain-containing protein [Pedobacter cryotolerans]TKB99364.1 DUF2339 domain-containing protein [Pedobacter cryotolerans]